MSTNQAPAENALTDIRAEWVPSDYDADGNPIPPTDPEWNRFSDYLSVPGAWGGDAGTDGQPVAGSGDLAEHFRAAEEHDLTFEYWLQREFTDGSGTVVDPAGVPLSHDFQTDYPSHHIQVRREVGAGGTAGGGFREFIVGFGCRPVSVSLPGDPAAANPIPQELGYACERVRQQVIHQPSSSTTLTAVSTDDSDTMDLTVESEGASTSETITLTGTTEATGSTSFDDIDAAYLSSEPVGDVTITDGSDNDLLTLTGANTDGVEGERGVPTLGGGSHASAIGNAPENYQFIGTSATFDGGTIPDTSDRVHALDLDVEVGVTREPQQGTRRQAIDIGTRTAAATVDVAGPYESAAKNERYYRGESADLAYTFPDQVVTLNNATFVDTDDVERAAGDENLVYGFELEAHGSPAVSLSSP
jgi:hypothetical protein